ncbi:DUF433 domain-containing protein [Janibacter terrae]|uniref:DUF433 domain-containing protein n=1 Tax=Janibacter terrae TaxID=103817 RepID=UPI0031F807A8
MAYPLKLTSKLTGATPSQLHRWRRSGLVVPEVRPYRPPLYSFRDILAIRTIAFLRAETSAQRVSRAFQALDLFDLTEHPSRYRFGTDGKTILVETDDGRAMDLVDAPGKIEVFPFAEALGLFRNFRDREVRPLDTPAEGISVRLQRMAGWPTIEGTRIPYDTIADLVDFETVRPEDVPHYYPQVSAEQALQAVDFDRAVEAVSA